MTTSPQSPGLKRHHFRLKGERAERVVQELAERSFLTDWCYPNPRLPNGEELCDLLVIYDDIATIWSVKNLTPYKPKRAEKSLRQLGGARRQLFELGTLIELENPRRGREPFDPSRIKRIFLISVLMGEDPDSFAFAAEVRKQTAHVLTGDTVQVLLNELDTVADFTLYLERKEAFLEGETDITVLGGEEELLALYLLGNRSFDAYSEPDSLLIQDGHWESFQKRPEVIRRKKEDEISYGWDSIIDRAHEGSRHYEIVARELARPNRFERRVLAKAFFEAHVRAHEEAERQGNPSGLQYRRVMSGPHATYLFLFMEEEEPRSVRKKALATICYVARGEFPDQPRVIGIATEMLFRPTCSYDFGLIHFPEWTTGHRERADQIKRSLGLFQSPDIGHFHEDEYPEPDDEP